MMDVQVGNGVGRRDFLEHHHCSAHQGGKTVEDYDL
jgi:hypothetical protein